MGFDRRFHLDTPTGARLQVYASRPEARPRAVVQINHGLAEHAGRYGRFAGFLAAHGFAAYAHDHRGHGGTKAPDAPRGTFARQGGADAVLADILAVHDGIAENHPGIPVVLFGHSMGGLLALDFLARHPRRVAAAAIWNASFPAGPAGRLAQAILAYERFRLGSDVPSRLLPRLTFQTWAAAIPNARTPFDWLSHDEGEVARYIADPACGWAASVGLWRDLFALIFAAAPKRLAGIPRDMPIQLAGGGQDPATDHGKAVERLARRLRRAGLRDVTMTIHPAMRHETLNETGRETAMEDFLAWTESRIARPRN